MKKLRIHSVDVFLSDGGDEFEWVLMIEARNYAEVASLAEQHIATQQPAALINEMNIQAQTLVDNASPGIRFAGVPRLIRKA